MSKMLPGGVRFGEGEANGFGLSANQKVVARHVLTSTVTVNSVIVRWFTSSATAQTRAIIYADNGSGAPGLKLAESYAVVGLPNRANLEYFLITPLVLNPGIYYVGVIADSGVTVGTSSDSTRWFNNDTYSDGASDPFGAATSFAGYSCAAALAGVVEGAVSDYGAYTVDLPESTLFGAARYGLHYERPIIGSTRISGDAAGIILEADDVINVLGAEVIQPPAGSNFALGTPEQAGPFAVRVPITVYKRGTRIVSFI